MEKLIGKRIFVFDTETTGLPEFMKGFDRYYDYHDTQKYDSSRLVEISWYYSENFNGEYNMEDIHSYLIIPTIPYDKWPKIDDKHRISFDEASKGYNLSDILVKHSLSEHINNTDVLVGHNVLFDYYVLASELSRIKNSEENLESLDKLIQKGKIFDTQKYGEKICKLPCKNPYYYKKPSLSELYFHLHKVLPQNAHRAKDDVITVLDCINKINVTKICL